MQAIPDTYHLKMTIVNSDFAKWAVGFSGCDGGNPMGSIWVCGIEPGGGETRGKVHFADVTVPGFVGDPSNSRDEFIRHQHNWKAVKLLAAMQQEDVSAYKDFYARSACFARDSSYFKLNLFPLSFPNTSHSHWEPWIAELTGFASKREYEIWCETNRFPVMADWARTYRPKAIICTGTTDPFCTWFQKAFGFEHGTMSEATVEGKLVKHFVTRNGATHVVITYFLGGRRGLNSNKQIEATGHYIARLLNGSD